MKKILIKHGIIALVLAALWVSVYLYADSIHGGLDSIGDAIIAAVMILLVAGAFAVNLFLAAAETVIHFAPRKGKIIVSGILLSCYAAALVYVVWDAFSFSHGKFFSYLAEGEFFSYLHVLFFAVLIVMILLRIRKLRKL